MTNPTGIEPRPVVVISRGPDGVDVHSPDSVLLIDLNFDLVNLPDDYPDTDLQQVIDTITAEREQVTDATALAWIDGYLDEVRAELAARTAA